MAFDPDEYLAGKSAEPSVATASSSDGFDPDAYLSSKAESFDPDAYLAEKEAAPKQTFSNLAGIAMSSAAKGGLEAATFVSRVGAKVGPVALFDTINSALGLPSVSDEIIREMEGASARASDEYGVDPKRTQDFPAQLASGAGSLLPTLASGPLAPFTGAAMMGEQGLREAKEAGATPTQQVVSAVGNAATGLVTEKLLGLPALMKSVKAAKIPERTAKALIGTVVKQVGLSAAREGTQETLEQISSDTIAKYIAAYDPDRQIFDPKKLATTFAVGAVLGAPVGGLVQTAETLDSFKEQNQAQAETIDADLQTLATAEPPPLTQVPPVVQEGIYTEPPEGEGDVFAGKTQPVTQDAQTIPSDEAQVSPGGIAEEPSGVPSGEDLQQPAPKEPSGTALPRTEETEFIGTAIDAPEGIVTRETGTSHAELVQEAIEKGAPFDKTLEEKQGFAFRKPDGSIEWVDRIEAGKRLVAMGLLKGFTPGDILTSEHIRNEVEGVTFTPAVKKPAPKKVGMTEDEAANQINKYRDAAIALAKRKGATDLNAEDIFQKVMLDLTPKLASGELKPTSIAGLVNQGVTFATSKEIKPTVKGGEGVTVSGDIEGPTGETAITEAATTRGPRAESVSQEDIQTIEQAVESLPESERNVMKLMVDNPGMSDAEIGKQVGLTENAVRQAKFRARNKLKEFIRSQGIGERMAPGAANEKEFQRARYIAGTDIYMGLESAGQLTRETWERNMERIYEDAFTPEQLDDAWRVVQLAAQEAKETRKPVTSVISQMMGVEQGKEGITALKNAQADLERRKRGLPAAMDAARRSQPSVWDEAMRLMDATDGRYQEDILAKLRNDPRATLNDVEIMTLLHAKIQAENLFDTYVQEVNSAKDRDSQLVAIQKAKDAEAKLIEIYDLAKQVGSEQGRAFAARRMLVARDYSIPRLTAELRAAQLGEELSTEQKELVQKISENVERTDSELEARTAELEEEQSRKEFEQAVREFQSQPKIDPRILALAEKIVARLDAAAAKARERILSRMQRLNSGLDPTFLYDYAVIGASKIAHGLKDLAWRASMRDEFGEGINPYLDDIYQKSDEMINNLENEIPEADRPKVRKAVRKTEAQDVIKSTTAEIKTRMEGGESLREMRFQVQKMALELVRSGVTTPDGLLDAMHAILEPIQPGMTRRQVMDLISGYGDLKALDMESAKVTLRDLKGQYQQLAKLEDIQGGLEPAKTGIERRKPSMSEKELIRRVNEARQKFGVGTLEAYKARLQNQIADLELRIKRKDFRKKIRKSVDISKDAEAVRLLAENERWKRKFAEARYEARKSAETKFQKAQRYGKEILNVPRAVKSSLDFSAVLRQGGFISLGNPLRAARNLKPMFEAAFSQEKFEKSEAEIRSRPNANKYKQSKLYLASMDGDLSNREEAFRSEFSDKIPGVKGSNRAYIGFLNRMRADTFDALVNNLPHTPTPEQLQAIAHYINVATGRGDLGVHGSAAETLSTVLWSPRLLISRIQLLAAEPMASRNAAGVRKVIAKEYAKALTGAAIVIGLGLAAGADVEDDPRSSDFGKLKFGNTRVDPWMGLQQITVLGSRLGTGETKTQGGEILSLRKTDDKKRPPWAETGFDVSARFLRTKMTPLLGEFFNVVSGETVVGEKVTPSTTAQGLLLPLSIGDVLPIMEEQGVPRGIALQILNLFGMSVQHYDKNK